MNNIIIATPTASDIFAILKLKRAGEQEHVLYTYKNGTKIVATHNGYARGLAIGVVANGRTYCVAGEKRATNKGVYEGAQRCVAYVEQFGFSLPNPPAR